MKKEELPQDPSVLDKFTKDLCYVVDESGNYTTGLSRGWEVKAAALDLAWDDIKERIEDARQKALKGEISPLLFFMELRLMDMDTLAGYSGFWKWQIKRHMKPNVFKNLSEKKLQRYAKVFEVSVDDLKNVRGNENQF
ncbi:MAG: hypothetical protein K0R51_2631 [Cytophagaceae bacterium]|jgi:hypothetical protein|nr:hypothetical protein [Cytophagaceae bacterium]